MDIPTQILSYIDYFKRLSIDSLNLKHTSTCVTKTIENIYCHSNEKYILH